MAPGLQCEMCMKIRTLFVSLIPFLSLNIGTGCIGDDSEFDADTAETGEETGEKNALAAGCDAAKTGDHYEFLDDVCRRKKIPVDKTRFLGCPTNATSENAVLAGTNTVVTYAPAAQRPTVDGNALRGMVSDDILVSLIMLRRVEGKVFARYLSNGTQDRTFYPWSSTKFMAASVAATTLRAASGGKAGLDSTVVFNGQSIPLGDVVTAIANYDESKGLSSNLSAKYFWNVGGRKKANDLLHGWLGRPAAESIGANYGAGDQGLPYSFKALDNSVFSVNPDRSSFETNMSTLGMAEFMKRLATHMDVAETRMPGLQRADVERLFYGAGAPVLFPGQPGGLSADTAVYVQSGLNMAQVQADSRGKWRTFGKLGFGDSSNGTTNFVHNSYTCLPVLDAAGNPVVDAGAEFVLSVRLAAPVGTSRATDRKLAAAVQAIVSRIADGRLR
jgi:hypothetical protein